MPCAEVTFMMYTPAVYSDTSSLWVRFSVWSTDSTTTPLISVTCMAYVSFAFTRIVTSLLNGFGYAAISKTSAFPSKRTTRTSVYKARKLRSEGQSSQMGKEFPER